MKIQMNTKINYIGNKNLLDSLYNHKPICEALLKEGYASASALFHKRAMCIRDLSEHDISILRCVFLNSLNKSLYNFVLYAWDISLAECCYENLFHSHEYENYTAFLMAGDEILKSYACQICSACPQSSHIERACCYIDSHINEELTLDIVAQNTFVSKSYLAQTFKPITGEGFSEYITNRRIAIAKNLLLTTTLKIDEIASQCGFFSSTYFSTVFKKQTDFSPSTFRKRFSGTAFHDLAI
ncbi:MAG: helix-turn-helix transcriptional regulator [Clostridiales bacterium]|nr:helix-turn-helix transcriptional regulator [Clostridiales bacterium]